MLCILPCIAWYYKAFLTAHYGHNGHRVMCKIANVKVTKRFRYTKCAALKAGYALKNAVNCAAVESL